MRPGMRPASRSASAAPREDDGRVLPQGKRRREAREESARPRGRLTVFGELLAGHPFAPDRPGVTHVMAVEYAGALDAYERASRVADRDPAAARRELDEGLAALDRLDTRLVGTLPADTPGSAEPPGGGRGRGRRKRRGRGRGRGRRRRGGGEGGPRPALGEGTGPREAPARPEPGQRPAEAPARPEPGRRHADAPAVTCSRQTRWTGPPSRLRTSPGAAWPLVGCG